jgi:hypothetical protein
MIIVAGPPGGGKNSHFPVKNVALTGSTLVIAPPSSTPVLIRTFQALFAAPQDNSTRSSTA